MGAKKTTSRRSRSVRYLLSADRRLKKLSLRKLSDRLQEKPARSAAASAKAPAAPRTAPASKGPQPAIPPPPKAYSWRAIVVGMACVLAAAALMTARQPAEEGDPAEPQHASVAPTTMAVGSSKAASSSLSKPVPKPASKPGSTPTSSGPSNGDSSASPAPARTPDEPAAAMKTVSAAGLEPKLPTATIAGCVERDADTFWLTDTSGDVAKSRSWKTGFLRKRSPRIELVGGPGAGTLSTYVGKRVEATGTLVDRELRARSVRRVAASCR